MDEAMDSDIRLSCGRRLPSRPTYVIPEPFYELLGESTTRANFVFSCKLCGGGKTISTYYRSRDNLRNHIRSTHPEFISAYDVWCSEHSRKPGMRCYSSPVAPLPDHNSIIITYARTNRRPRARKQIFYFR